MSKAYPRILSHVASPMASCSTTKLSIRETKIRILRRQENPHFAGPWKSIWRTHGRCHISLAATNCMAASFGWAAPSEPNVQSGVSSPSDQ